MYLKILELFSGIGGMHYAFKQSDQVGEVVIAMDINEVANTVYNHNHQPVKALNKNIVGLTVKSLEKLKVNTILMSPPCQPHTRLGYKRDVADARSDALTHLCELIPQCPGLQFILMENVKGFESSQARDNYVAALESAGFHWREFILSPTQLSVPNTRHRYYCIARKKQDFPFAGGLIWREFPIELSPHTEATPRRTIQTLLEPPNVIATDNLVPMQVLTKRVWLLDIVNADASNTMCFTKAYTHYAEGTGSVLTALGSGEMKKVFEEIKAIEEDEDARESNEIRRQELLKSLQLRYFTPREEARLMSFPETFEFPAKITTRQKYRLLGNSINVAVVSELIKIMLL